jgi:putative tricarboxylic transport membrane protein
MLIFGVIGYVFRKFGYELAPLIIAFVLGPMLETSLRQSLLISKGDISIFFVRPISVACLAIALVLLVSPIILRQSRRIRAKIT